KCGGWGYIDSIGRGRGSPGPTGSDRNRAVQKRPRTGPKNTADGAALPAPFYPSTRIYTVPSTPVKATAHKGKVARTRPVIPCQLCAVQVREDRMASHVLRVHSAQTP